MFTNAQTNPGENITALAEVIIWWDIRLSLKQNVYFLLMSVNFSNMLKKKESILKPIKIEKLEKVRFKLFPHTCKHIIYRECVIEWGGGEGRGFAIFTYILRGQ